MRARIKEGWYPYGVGLIVHVFSTKAGFQIVDVIEGTRKNFDLCKNKLVGKIITKEFLDFNYNNMRDTEKTIYARIKDTAPFTQCHNLLVEVELSKRTDMGDRYKIIDIISICSENVQETFKNTYIMDDYLDFSGNWEKDYDGGLVRKGVLKPRIQDETNYLLSTEANRKALAKSIEDVEKGNVRHFTSGAQRDADENKPYVHNLQGYTRLRFGYLTRTGAKKYGDGNFLKGFPDDSLIQSMDRHWAQYLDGDRTEDHLAALLFGVNSLMLNEKKEGIKADHWFKNQNNGKGN
jgi:dATP/dGTP diphosphohydrolase